MRMWWTILFFLASTGSAAPFSKYRAELSTPTEHARLAKLAAAQIQEARKAMGTDSVQYPTLSQGAFVDLKKSNEINGNKLTSSGILKLRLGRVGEALREREKDGASLPFDPSKFDFEIDQDRANARYAFCEKAIGPEYPIAVNELLFEHLKSLKAPTPSSTATALELRLVAELRPLLPAAAAQKLGTLAALDFVDGKITKLYFLPANGPEYPVTFSLLSTFRTQRDKYFLVTLECVRRHLEIKANEEKPADAEYQSTAKLLLPVVTGKLREAGEIHARVSTLTKPELHALLDLFLVLQGDDFPSKEEMQIPDDPKTWKVGQNPPSFPTLIFLKTEPAVQKRNALLIQRQTLRANKQNTQAFFADAAADAVMDLVSEPLADYQFYRLFYRHTQELLEAIGEEKQRAAVEQKILKDMGGN